MAQLPKPIDESTTGVIPEGWYQMIAYSSDIVENRAKTGYYLEINFMITDGAREGDKLTARFNIVNTNPQAQQIAERQLGALRKACGIEVLSDSEQVHEIPVEGYVEVEPATDKYDESNSLEKFRAIGVHAIDGTQSSSVPARENSTHPEAGRQAGTTASNTETKKPLWARK